MPARLSSSHPGGSHEGRKTDSAHRSDRRLGARANSRRLGPGIGLRARRAGSNHMRRGVEFHRCLHRRQPGQRERDQLHRQLVDSGQRPGDQQRRQRLGTAVDVRRRLHRLGGTPPAEAAAPGGGGGHGHRLGERPALQPLQGRHHQHELEHLPDAVGRGRVRHSVGGLRQRGIDLCPEAARDHARVRDRSLRQRDLGWCLGCHLGGREHSAAQQRRPELRGLDRR